VIILPVGLQVLAAHSAYSPEQVVMPAVDGWANTGVDSSTNARIANSFFMFIFLGMVGLQVLACRQSLL
jgi:hypothetical protein